MTNTPIAADQVPGGGKIIYHRNSDGKIVEAGADNPLPVAATVSATAQTVAKATAATPSYLEGDTAAPLSVDLSGNLRTLASVSASIAATANASDPSWVEASSHGLTTDLAGYLRSLCKQVGIWSMKIDQTTPGTTNGVAATNFPTAVSVNSGAKDNGTLRIVFATDQPQNTNAFKVDGSAVTQPAGIVPVTSGGLTPHKLVSAATTNGTSVKASAGQLYEIVCGNTSTSPRYLKLYNKASAPTVGTDTPVWTLLIPSQGTVNGAGLAKSLPQGLAFATGIAYAVTSGAADADTGAIGANEVTVNLGYK